MPFFRELCEMHDFLINLWIHRLIHGFILMISKGLIFSVLLISQKYFHYKGQGGIVHQIKVIICNYILIKISQNPFND